MFHIFTLMCSYTIVRLLACKHDKLQCHFDVKTLDVKAFLHNVKLAGETFHYETDKKCRTLRSESAFTSYNVNHAFSFSLFCV